ncbi:hypothetical protein QVD17_07926 [Tagetes erecta]|uniref:Uncharacterized protein n=1 Tax=Tagetes erecta TaxID=13708 RepID=A0AAD8KYE4_TARER|nr:hypothetical protein QVD17_07926 [Tagetes erecta]
MVMGDQGYRKDDVAAVDEDINTPTSEESVCSNQHQSPNDTKYWVPIVSDGLKPPIGMLFSEWEEVHAMYEKYVEASGFDIRMSTN